MRSRLKSIKNRSKTVKNASKTTQKGAKTAQKDVKNDKKWPLKPKKEGWTNQKKTIWMRWEGPNFFILILYETHAMTPIWRQAVSIPPYPCKKQTDLPRELIRPIIIDIRAIERLKPSLKQWFKGWQRNPKVFASFADTLYTINAY